MTRPGLGVKLANTPAARLRRRPVCGDGSSPGRHRVSQLPVTRVSFRAFWGGLQDSLAAAVVKQSLGMNADQFIAARVSSETKARLRTLADQHQLSESALLKRLLDLTLNSTAESRPVGEERVRKAVRAARLYVRLRPDDRLLLAERAAARSMAAATYVSVLVRAHLRPLTPLPKDELLALKRSVAELGAIGRNFNQIARAANQAAPTTGPCREDLFAMLKVCEALRDHVKALIKANTMSWEVGYAEPSP